MISMMNLPTQTTMMSIGTNANIDQYRPMMTLFREPTTSRTNLTIDYVVKALYTVVSFVSSYLFCSYVLTFPMSSPNV
jgi:hypothetical protein